MHGPRRGADLSVGATNEHTSEMRYCCRNANIKSSSRKWVFPNMRSRHMLDQKDQKHCFATDPCGS
jgi:hypothetical protein